MEKTKLSYFENLDGLRFFAFLIVFISHATLFLGFTNNSPVFYSIRKYFLINGDVGVSFFFVLSGFLITYLLFREKDNNGKISLKHFYQRRILRIWPVYFTTLIIGFFILPVVARMILSGSFSGGNFIFSLNPPFSILPHFIFFLANFVLAFFGGSSVPTDVLWSVSVEEQFYLVWPWVIAFIPRKYLLKFLSGIILISCIYRYTYAFSPDILAYSTLSVMSNLAIGGVLAYFVYVKNSWVEKVFSSCKSMPRKIVTLIYLLTFSLIFGRQLIYDYLSGHSILYKLSISILPLILAFLYALIIFEQNESGRSLFKIGKSKTLSFFGKISYGLYSYHMFAIVTVLLTISAFGFNIRYSSPLEWVILAALSLLGVFILAIISYYGMEKKFLKMKPKD
ncbi:MAG: acyltransferase [bacterium]